MGFDIMPLILLMPSVQISTVFYILLEITTRTIASYLYPKKISSTLMTEKEIEREAENDKTRETIGRYTPSLIHSYICTGLYLLLVFSEDYGLNKMLIEQWMMGHTFGYFIGDMIVDRDPDYFLHHIAPLIHGEILLRAGAYNYFFHSGVFSLYHSARCLAFIEIGNMISHTVAMGTNRTGHIYHFFLVASLWISRPVSLYDGFHSWLTDLPEENKYQPYGLILLFCITLTYAINLGWMYKMFVAIKHAMSGAPTTSTNEKKSIADENISPDPTSKHIHTNHLRQE